MEDQQIKPLKTGSFALKYGIFLGLISVAFAIMLFTMDLHYQRSTTNTIISIVIIVFMVVIAIYQFKKENSGYLTLGQALKIGLGVALIAAIISVIYTIVLFNVLDPDFMDKSFEYTKDTILEQNPNITEQQLEQNRKIQKNFAWVAYPVILIFNLFAGFVISLIAGLIMKKTKND